MTAITRLLVANRGEVAVRVRHTAESLGIPCVAVYAADEADGGHLVGASEAVRLDATGPAAYLDAAAMVEAARRTGCDAVHPGYGFLSERASFAEACARAGLTFVGPSPAALTLFGDKAAARVRAAELEVPLLAGSPVLTGEDPAADERVAAEFAAALGGEVMVKAVAGGGGLGMRPLAVGAALRSLTETNSVAETQANAVTETEPDQQVALNVAFLRAEQKGIAGVLARCRSEAERAFGSPALYLERLLRGARHVEVQLLGDRTGAVVALGDRDCSAQRRRQKLVEIAPAPGLPDGLRERLHAAAVRLGESVDRLGLATAEFLVYRDEFVFLEVNARLQVEHTVTEEVTGLDLVELQLAVAGGAALAELGLTECPPCRGTAVQARVNAETPRADGEVHPAAGTPTRFEPPAGRGVRVDTAAGQGLPVSPRYDSLLAKLIVTGVDPSAALTATERSLGRFRVDGVATNLGVLRALLRHPDFRPGEVHTGFVDEHLAELVEPEREQESESVHRPECETDGELVRAPRAGVVVELPVAPGDARSKGAPLAVLEAMKMEHEIPAPGPVEVVELLVKVGDAVGDGTPLVRVEPAGHAAEDETDRTENDPDHIRTDLAETLHRHYIGSDEGRPEAAAKRHEKGRLTARESLDALCDPDSFVEYGALVIAAQRRRRSVAELIERTPADGMVTGTARIHGTRCAVMSYDYTVLAGTQGVQNHRKTDRLLELARREKLPTVIFAEGGGGRPGDTDQAGFTGLDVPTFHTAAALVGEVPTVAVVGGYCFAGNAALAGVCDVLIAVEGASLGMGGPAMIAGGGLGQVAPGDVGPMSVQVPNGVVDLLVPDDRAAADAARRYLDYATGNVYTEYTHEDQRLLRAMVPENRVRAYPVRGVLDTLFDTGSVLELRQGFGIGMITAFARLAGHPVGVIANNPLHLGGAIDSGAADKAARFLQICDAYGLPVVSLCDTPGFMVGPEEEANGAVRRFGAMFVAGAKLRMPPVVVVLRKGYGLGAMAMAGGGFRATRLTASWPTGEFGGMNLEGSVELGYRAELSAIEDPAARRERYEELVARLYEHGKALSVASTFDLDDVIDPADTRTVLTRALGF